MKFKPYKKILVMAKDKIDELLVAPRANKAKKQLELELAKREEELATLENSVQEKVSSKDLAVVSILTAMNDVALKEREIKQVKQLLEDLFPSE